MGLSGVSVVGHCLEIDGRVVRDRAAVEPKPHRSTPAWLDRSPSASPGARKILPQWVRARHRGFPLIDPDICPGRRVPVRRLSGDSRDRLSSVTAVASWLLAFASTWRAHWCRDSRRTQAAGEAQWGCDRRLHPRAARAGPAVATAAGPSGWGVQPLPVPDRTRTAQAKRGHPAADREGLRISAEQLYVRAGILETGRQPRARRRRILADRTLDERQKQVLLDIYESFCRENAQHEQHDAGLGGGASAPGGGAVAAATAK